MVGINTASDGLARAAKFGFEVTVQGVDGLLKSPQIDEIGIVFDAPRPAPTAATTRRCGRVASESST